MTAGGKNVAPQNIENDLKTSKYVSQALVVGDRAPLRRRAAHARSGRRSARWAAEQGIDGDVAALAPTRACASSCRTSSTTSNRDRSRFEQVKRFAILPRDFTMEHGEITPTLKLRRRAVQEHFAAEIDALYAEPTGGGRRRLTAATRDDSGELARARGRRAPTKVDAYQDSYEARDLHDVARVRRVDELAAADVDPDVAETVEEDEVAGRQLVA